MNIKENTFIYKIAAFLCVSCIFERKTSELHVLNDLSLEQTASFLCEMVINSMFVCVGIIPPLFYPIVYV